jgi:predicted outer membrane protein
MIALLRNRLAPALALAAIMVSGLWLGNGSAPAITPVAAAAAMPTPGPDEVMTKWGPLSEADKFFLDRVRQAGLWEIPAGQMAQQRAANPRVKEVGIHLINDHNALDDETRFVAAQLGHTVPNQASADQQRWMAEMNSLTGADFDLTFARLLRAAHGGVFAVIAQIRAGTRNDLIRQFATRTNSVVLKHISILEGTGLVNYEDLNKPKIAGVPQPGDVKPLDGKPPVGRQLVRTSEDGGGFELIPTVLLLGIAAMVAVASVIRVNRGT